MALLRHVQKQSASLKAYKKWFKALLESSQALVDGRNEAADLDKEIKLREKDLQVPQKSERGEGKTVGMSRATCCITRRTIATVMYIGCHHDLVGQQRPI